MEAGTVEPQQPPVTPGAVAPAAQPVETPAQPENQPEGKETKVETEETPQRRESRRQRQLNRERTARITAETEARLLRERIAALEGKVAPSATLEKGVDQDAPKREAFESYEEFIRAEARYYARKEAREAAKLEREEHSKKESENREKQTQDQIARRWQERVEDARDDIEDFDDVTVASEAVITPAMAFAIQDSDKGAHIAYHLAKNPQEAERISKLSPSKQAAAIVALEEKVAKPAKQPSKAPEPINPVGKKGGDVDKDPVQMTDAEYAAYRKKRRAAKGLT